MRFKAAIFHYSSNYHINHHHVSLEFGVQIRDAPPFPPSHPLPPLRLHIPHPRQTRLPPLLPPPLPILVQVLRKLAPRPDLRPLPVHDVDGDCDEERQTRQDRARVLQRPTGDVLVHGRRVQRGDSGEKVAREVVAAGGGGGVRAVGGGLVVDGGLVDGVLGVVRGVFLSVRGCGWVGTYVCDGDEGGEDHGGDPGDAVGGAERGPGEAEEADGFERGEEEEPPEADLGFEGDALSAFATEVVDGGQIGEVGEEVPDQEAGESQLRSGGTRGEHDLRDES